MRCLGCRDPVQPNAFVKCNKCESVYCYLCLKIDPRSAEDQIQNVQCPSCNITRRRPGIITSQHTTPETTPRKSVNGEPSSVGPASAEPVTLAAISALFDRKFEEKFSTLFHEITKIKEEFTNTTDFIMEEIRDLKTENEKWKKDFTQIEADKSTLQNEVYSLRKRILTLENISRGNNFEIQALPEKPNENVPNLVKTVLKNINSQVLDSDIRSCRRVTKADKSSTRPRNILVSLSSPRTRDDILLAYKNFNQSHPDEKLNSKHAGVTEGQTTRIYICEHLSPETKHLYAEARKCARDKKYDFVWVKYGQIYVRKNKASDPIRVTDVGALQKM